MRPRWAPLTLLALGVAAAAPSGCRQGGAPPIRVGSKNFTEQVLLGEIAAQALEARGLRVDRKLDLGGTFVCHRALLSGGLDLYPEYTGTAYAAVLAKKPISDPARVREEVAAEYARRFRLVWSKPLGFENTFALIMRTAQARELSISRISDLARHADRLRPGFGYEFVERADGFPGLAAAYGLRFGARPVEMDLGLLYPALAQDQVDVVAGNSTDGLIAAMNLTVLEDDRRYFPPYEAAFVLRTDAWNNAAVRAALEPLSGAISAEAMRRMNAQIDRDKRRPEEIAAQFLGRLEAARAAQTPGVR